MELAKKWTPELEKKIEEILNNAPEVDMDWRKWAPQPTRRNEAIKY